MAKSLAQIKYILLQIIPRCVHYQEHELAPAYAVLRDFRHLRILLFRVQSLSISNPRAIKFAISTKCAEQFLQRSTALCVRNLDAFVHRVFCRMEP